MCGKTEKSTALRFTLPQTDFLLFYVLAESAIRSHRDWNNKCFCINMSCEYLRLCSKNVFTSVSGRVDQLERLTAAAAEIFSPGCGNFLLLLKHLLNTAKENLLPLQDHPSSGTASSCVLHHLDLDSMDTDVQQLVLVKEEGPEEQSAGVDQQDPEHLHIKEEQEELWTSLEGEHLCLKEETEAVGFPVTAVSIKSEDDDEKPLVSQLHQQQIEDRDVPTSSSADQMTAETGGGAGTSRNPDLNPHDQTSDSSETEVSGDDDDDDVNLDSELSDSGSETGDEDDDWNESRSSESEAFQQVLLVKEEALEEHSTGVNQQDLDFLHLKEEQEKLWPSMEGAHLHLKEETDAARFPVTVASTKSEDDEEKPLFSQLHQKQIEDRDVSTSSAAHQTTAETGGLETSRNPDRNPHELTDDDDDNDANLDSELSDSGSETGDRDNDWNENRCSESDFKTVNKSFSHRTLLNSHMRVHTGQKTFACEFCEKQFSLKSTLNTHMRVHTGQKPFACEFCSKIFSQKTTLNNHMRVHTGQKPFACELCGKRYSVKTTLNKHMRVHTGEKPFACELCGKRYSQKTHLNRHMRVHTGQKPFACELCGKRYSLKTTLNTHMRVHTGEKPFACELCGKRFSKKTNLNRHMGVHTGQKPFVCELCGKRYNLKTTLNTHMRVHTGEKPFACELCGKRFSEKTNLNRHMGVHK
ncbi:uncharacterized protein [Nothobranchius furzeri]|uniref:uncharacterized protein n=1 Tax=Nothobranchius furzeri TaxID=105023 RepID=UPI003904A69D